MAGSVIRLHFLGLALLGPVSLMAACATPTPYQQYQPEGARGIHGGYSDQRLAPNRFKVSFHGNELTSRDRVENYLLYRAAELTVASGYDWFMIADRHTEHDVETHVRESPWGYWQPHWRYQRYGYGWDVWHPEYGGAFWANQIDVSRVESFEVTAEIVLGKGAASEPAAFDARRVMTAIGPMVELPKKR